MDQRPSQQFSSSRTMRKKAPREDLYTASQAITKTGIAKSTFQRLVREQRISKEIPTGKKEGFYSKPFIDDLTVRLGGKTSYQEVVDLLEQMAQAKTSLEGATDWIRFDDLPFVQHLDIEMYGPEETV